MVFDQENTSREQSHINESISLTSNQNKSDSVRKIYIAPQLFSLSLSMEDIGSGGAANADFTAQGS